MQQRPHSPSPTIDSPVLSTMRWMGPLAGCFNRERLTSSGERGVVGGCEIDTHQRQDRPQEAFRLAQGQPEDKAERQRRLDRTVRERLRTGRRRAPRVRGVGREPQRHVPSLDQGLLDADPFPTRYFVLYFGRSHVRAPAAVTVAREPTAASSQAKGCAPTPRRGSTVSCRPPQNWLDTRDSCSQAMRSQRNPVRFTTAARATVEPSVAGPTRHPAADADETP